MRTYDWNLVNASLWSSRDVFQHLFSLRVVGVDGLQNVQENPRLKRAAHGLDDRYI